MWIPVSTISHRGHRCIYKDAVAPAGTAQDAAPAASAVVEAAVDTAEAAMDAAPAASATGAEAAATEPEDLGTAELASQGRLWEHLIVVQVCAYTTGRKSRIMSGKIKSVESTYS